MQEKFKNALFLANIGDIIIRLNYVPERKNTYAYRQTV